VVLTNTATNPVPITNSDRPTAFNQSFQTNGVHETNVPIPTGCRLVFQVVSFDAFDTAPTAHQPTILLVPPNQPLNRPVFWIPTQQAANTNNTVGTLAMQMIVDSPTAVYVADAVAPTNAGGYFSISGYLLPLTPGASCSF